METVEDFIAKRIVIKGLVQGIGYRPFVAGLAEEYGITGWVRNTAGIVTVMAEGNVCQVEQFLFALMERKPEGARVDDVLSSLATPKGRKGFIIETSETETEKQDVPFLPPDLPTCENCRRELLDSRNRRYRYPFISCTSCGPRYSIIEGIPYDRPAITMRDFGMCQECSREYSRKGDIRRHAQTIACPDCGPVLSYVEIRSEEETAVRSAGGNEEREAGKRAEASETWDAEQRAVLCLQSGGIVAVKDIGGFHLACSPFNGDAVEALRILKGREKKPFAVMFPDIESVSQYCSVDLQEEEQLLSAPRPIVLLAAKEHQAQAQGTAVAGTAAIAAETMHTEGVAAGTVAEDFRHVVPFAENVCGLSPDIGAILPCNPLQILLTKDFGPLVMTSANRSGELIITENQRMEAWLTEAAAAVDVPLGILQHDRRIVTPLDDSVVRIVQKRRQIFRRARGMAPEPVLLPECASDRALFAAGGDLKSCFCFAEGNRAYLSQHLGDLQDEESQRMYREEAGRMKRLFGFSPKGAVSDLHPAYLSVKLTEQLLEEWQTEKGIIPIQHHFAHGASVIAEHGLRGKVLCITFDGTGYGMDGGVWGSEFLLWDAGRMKRLAHLKPVLLPGGDEGARNTQSILYGYLASFGQEFQEYLKERWKELHWLREDDYRLVRSALGHGINMVASSSMGRLFDAVSALLDICRYNGYEGEAPIELEYLASGAKKAYPLHIEVTKDMLGHTEKIFRDIIDAVISGVPREALACGFILAIADFVWRTCHILSENIWEKTEKKQVALSGGTFQNRILLEETIQKLEADGFLVFINEQVPSGDGGICLGQAYLCRQGFGGSD